jgi:type III restriction enzyme
MPKNADRQRFKNEDLVLRVAPHVDRSRWDESKYEPFVDELCGTREYQKVAIWTALRYLLGGEYSSLHDLARENFDSNDALQERYGSWAGMVRHLQLPNQLAATLDLATGTGKSYVLYGVAAILLSEGVVDRVLVLCPSTTIEAGLLGKFRQLAGRADLRDLLPPDARVRTPRIQNATETIVDGSICVENYHAVLEHVGSSVRDSLKGRGSRVAVLNDEAHHVANEKDSKVKRWKEFLQDPAYGFKYVIGVSGTCYVDDDYFADVIYRYSLRQAMEERYVKSVEYVADMPQVGGSDEKWQLIVRHHEETKRKLKSTGLLPLTIVVTNTIARCKDVSEELKAYLTEFEGLEPEIADERVLVVYNGAPDVAALPSVDAPASPVEWIVSVSMLTEGWDVKRVFQIVPHEERAFNSKLLIAQVLGRGLRVPDDWKGAQPEVTVFNHEAWAGRIKLLVAEVLEIERRISSAVRPESTFNFDLHNIDYTLEATAMKKAMTGEYDLLSKGIVALGSDVPVDDVEVEFERATGGRYKWKTTVTHKTHEARDVAQAMYARLSEAEDPDDPDAWPPGTYTSRLTVDALEKIVRTSLAAVDMEVATEATKQKFLQALGPLRRKVSETVRYTPVATRYYTLSTVQRQTDSVSASELRRDKTVFLTAETRETLTEEQVEFFDEIVDQGSGYKAIVISNRFDFKTPLNAAIADSDPERRFIQLLVKPENAAEYDAWLKSTPIRFYEIEYAWKKGEHAKRGKFSPDFFIHQGDRIIVVEIKMDDEIREPSPENVKKNEYAVAHFARVNEHLSAEGSPVRYHFTFLTPKDFGTFSKYLRERRIEKFKSELDVKLAETP